MVLVMLMLLLQADDSVDEETLNHYCWMFSTFDIPPDFKVRVSEKFVVGMVMTQVHSICLSEM